jgi:hypothetical protein
MNKPANENEKEHGEDAACPQAASFAAAAATMGPLAEVLFGAMESKDGEGDEQAKRSDNYRSFTVDTNTLQRGASEFLSAASALMSGGENSKPALRFVRHISCPDSTLVPPGVPFCKTWRVRNDGKCAWPEGATLVHSGGDQLSFEALPMDSFPAPGEERDISVTIKGAHSSAAH